MKRIFTIIICFLAAGNANARKTLPFLGKTVVLEDSMHAALANCVSDAYTQSQTAFDRAIRLHKAEGGTEQEYLALAAKSMRSWTPAEERALEGGLAAIEASATSRKLVIPTPDTLFICKTSAKEEFGAEGYTRANRIMLHAGTEELGAGLLAHELWHVLSRLNPKLRDSAYAVFGFRPCNRVDYKPAFKGQVISNPDCPFIEHYMTITQGGKPVDVAIVLYSGSPYVKGGGLMDYVAIGLLALEGDAAHKKVVMKNGKPVVYEFSDCPDFFRQAGENTEYMLHIEELTAEHFSALLTGRTMKQPGFVDRLGQVLR